MSKHTLHSPLSNLRFSAEALIKRVALSGILLAAPAFGAMAGTNVQSEFSGDAIHKLAPFEQSQHTPTLMPDPVPSHEERTRVASSGADIFGAVVGGAIIGAILASDDDHYRRDEVDEVYIEDIPSSDVIIIDDVPRNAEIIIDDVSPDTEIYIEDVPVVTEDYNTSGATDEFYVSQPVSRGSWRRGNSRKRRCARRYRSFDWRTGTFMTYRGVRKLCPYLRY